MASAAKAWKLKVFVRPHQDMSTNEGFTMMFSKYTNQDSFRSELAKSLRVPDSNDLALFEGDTQIPFEDFIASAMDYTRTGVHDLTTESAEYNDDAHDASVHVRVEVLSSVLGAPGSLACVLSHTPTDVQHIKQGCKHISRRRCRVYTCMPGHSNACGPLECSDPSTWRGMMLHEAAVYFAPA